MCCVKKSRFGECPFGSAALLQRLQFADLLGALVVSPLVGFGLVEFVLPGLEDGAPLSLIPKILLVLPHELVVALLLDFPALRQQRDQLPLLLGLLLADALQTLLDGGQQSAVLGVGGGGFLRKLVVFPALLEPAQVFEFDGEVVVGEHLDVVVGLLALLLAVGGGGLVQHGERELGVVGGLGVLLQVGVDRADVEVRAGGGGPVLDAVDLDLEGLLEVG